MYLIGKFVFLALLAVCVIGSSADTNESNDNNNNNNNNEGNVFDRGYRALYRVYEDCQSRNVAISPCLKKKAITFFERLGRIDSLPISENLELVKVGSPDELQEGQVSRSIDIEATLGRATAAHRDEILNDILLDRVSSLMNSFNVQIRLPKTTSGELKRSIEEGRGKMKKMMGMMMMGMAMKMAAMVPIAMGVLFLLAGKALIISKIALVLSLIIGLKKLLSQKQGNDHHGGGWQQQSGGWDRSLKDPILGDAITMDDVDREYAQNLAYKARQLHHRR